MKQISILLLAFLFGLSACKTNNNEVTITGKIIGEIPEYLKHSIPVNGICLGYFKEQIEVDSTGYFEFKINTTKPVFTNLFYPENKYCLIIEAGESYNIKIDCNENTFHIEGKNKKLIEIYQNLLVPDFHINMECTKYLELPIPAVKFKMDSMYNEEHQVFMELYNKNEISNEVYKLVDFDRYLFYQSLLSTTFKFKYFNARFKNREVNTDSIYDALNTSVNKIPFESDNFLNSNWAYYYLESFLESKEFMEKDYFLDARNEAKKTNLYHTYRISFSNKYLSGNIREFYNSANLLIAAYQEKYENELIILFEEYKVEFPQSKYTPTIEPYISEIINFQQVAELEFNEGVNFINDFQKINSLEELLKSFNGKKVYIDLWATWCGYCKDEFKYSKETKEILDSKNISILYISLDGEPQKQQWLDMIKFYDLRGYHLLANKNLHADLYSILNLKGIPHYVFIDENGKIIKNEAPFPSQTNKLKDLIENHQLSN